METNHEVIIEIVDDLFHNLPLLIKKYPAISILNMAGIDGNRRYSHIFIDEDNKIHYDYDNRNKSEDDILDFIRYDVKMANKIYIFIDRCARGLDSAFSGITTKVLDLKCLSELNMLTDINLMFANCKLSVLDITGINTTQVINMAGLFYGAKIRKIVGLQSLIIDSVKTFENTFNSCTLGDIDLSHWQTNYTCTYARGMFEKATIDSLILPLKLYSKKGIDITKMFYNAIIRHIDISEFEIYKIDTVNECYEVFNGLTIRDKVLNLNKFNIPMLDEWFANSTYYNSFRISHIFSNIKVDTLYIPNFELYTGCAYMYMFSYSNINNVIMPKAMFESRYSKVNPSDIKKDLFYKSSVKNIISKDVFLKNTICKLVNSPKYIDYDEYINIKSEPDKPKPVGNVYMPVPPCTN